MSNILHLDITQPTRRAGKLLLAPFRYLARKEHYLGPPSIALRVKFFLTGALLPLICVALMIAEGDPSTRRLWQSGDLTVYITLLMKGKAQVVFLPLLAFNIVSLCCWLIRPFTIRYLIVRLGVYSGIPLAAQYLFLICYVTMGIALIFSLIVGSVLAILVFLIDASYRRRRKIWVICIWSVIVIYKIVETILFFETVQEAYVGTLYLCAIAAPALTLLTYIRSSVMIAHQHKRQFGRERRSLLGWLLAFQALAATWFAGWKIAIDVMLFEYAKLPTSPPPNCYLSAAAQNRHTWLFRESAAGVSLQTKRLKFLEIALRCAAPKFHAALRRIYDHLGPPLAKFCRRSHWFADLTYLALLPLEASATLLRRALQFPRARVTRLYKND